MTGRIDSSHSWNFVSLHHSWNLSGFLALWFCQDHHVASFFIVRRSILKREIKHIRINLSLSTWFFVESLFIFVYAWGHQHDLDLSNFALRRRQWISLTYAIKMSLLVHVSLISWFNKYQHLKFCKSSWHDWYLGLNHSLALLHHIWYLDVKSSTCSSLMYGSPRPSLCWSFFNHYHDAHYSLCLQWAYIDNPYQFILFFLP
jgi:hypothetical protein